MKLQHKSVLIIAIISLLIIFIALFSGSAFETPSLQNNNQNVKSDNGKNENIKNDTVNTYNTDGTISIQTKLPSKIPSRYDSLVTAVENSNVTPHTIIKSELSTHTTINDCWVGYKGRVYDITNFLPKHPGTAQAILPYCGTAKAFEDAFTKKHGTSKANLLMKVGVFIGDFSIKGGVV